MTNLKSVEFTTEKGGVRPTVRENLKAQAIKHIGLDLSNLEKLDNGSYGMPIAIDALTGKEIYLIVETKVTFAPVKKVRTKSEPTPVSVPNLFE